ncbi:MAG: ABC transporter ATP-binding protein [Erysipelothrix sp.]|nr:ABC transporter ATP-binding protein [Erysipelothrix sp.]
MKLFDGYKIKSIASIGAKFLEAVFEIMIPLFMGRLIDVGITGNDTAVIIQSVIWMLVLSIVGYGFALVCQINASIVSQGVGGRLRSQLFAKELSLNNAMVNRYSSTSLSNRVLLDTIYVQDMIARIIRLGIRAPFLIIGTLGALMMIHRDLAIILLIAIPIFSLVIGFFMFMSMKKHKQVNDQLDGLVLKVSEILSGSRIIRAFSKQEVTDKQFVVQNEKLYEAQHKVGWYATLANPFTTLIMNGLLILLVYVSGININIGTMSQGQTLAVINYCSQLLLTLIVTMNFIMVLARGMTSYKRIQDIMNIEDEVIQHKQLTDDHLNLSFNQISFSYPDEKRKILDNVSFEIKADEVIGIIGLTGSGKSTILKLIVGLLTPSSGEILINEQHIQSFNAKSIRDHIGYIPQKPQFLSGRLDDNIQMQAEVDVKQMLLDVEGHDILNKGLESSVEEGAKNFSGGQRQRINIARAMAKDPKLLLFDDSFSALDNLTSARLLKTLRTKYKHIPKIITSQRTAPIEKADKIIVLDQGRIIGVGRHSELLKHNELYQNIYALEKGGVNHE